MQHYGMKTLKTETTVNGRLILHFDAWCTVHDEHLNSTRFSNLQAQFSFLRRVSAHERATRWKLTSVHVHSMKMAPSWAETRRRKENCACKLENLVEFIILYCLAWLRISSRLTLSLMMGLDAGDTAFSMYSPRNKNQALTSHFVSPKPEVL